MAKARSLAGERGRATKCALVCLDRSSSRGINGRGVAFEISAQFDVTGDRERWVGT
jgi:hypothetical protein